jgi:hypothetical protein
MLRLRLPSAAALLATAGLAISPRPCPATAAETAGGGALRFTTDPPELVLGRDVAAELRIAAPPEVAEIELTASAGRIEGLHRLPAGGFAARYRPPPERFPRVALVAALGRGSAGTLDGWIAIPLLGQADARVHARPGTEISLQVADRSFGPRRAGKDGIAVIPIVVPPGVREAHHGFRPIDLRVPDTSLLHVAAERATLRADLAGEVKAHVYVVAPHGAARRGDVPVLEPSRGEVAISPREPGAFEVTWRLPPGPAGEERLVARLPGSAASRAVVRVETVAGPPATVAVAFDREELVAGSATEVSVTARVLDAAGNSVPAKVALAADTGTLTSVAERSPGRFEATLRLPSSFGGRRAAVVTARAPDAGIGGSRALPLVPAAPASARFTPADVVVLADGNRDASLRLSVVDRFENPVPRLTPAVSAARGRILEVTSEEPGVYLVRYSPPSVEKRTAERLEVELHGVKARADLVLVPPRRGLSVETGAGAALDVRGRFAGPSLSAAAELAVDPLPDPFAARMELSWLAYRWDAPPVQVGRQSVAGGTVDASLAVLAVGVSARREMWPRLDLWGSASAGIAWGRTQGGVAENGLAPAGRVAAGCGWRFPWGVPFAEVGLLAYSRTGGSFGAGAAATLAAGIRFDLENVGRRSSARPAAAGPGASTPGDPTRRLVHGDHPDRG